MPVPNPCSSTSPPTITSTSTTSAVNKSRPAPNGCSCRTCGATSPISTTSWRCAPSSESPVIEDCAHTMGGAWDGRPTGTFGIAGCFSTQTFKHVNSGEGGLLVTDDEDLAARAILLSGSYMLYGQHGARPGDDVFERHRLTTPNFSMRMSALTAALVRPQLGMLAKRAEVWNARYAQLAESLGQLDGVRVPERDQREQFVASSIQFNVDHPDIAVVRSARRIMRGRTEMVWS